MSCAIALEIGAGSSPGEFLTRVVDAPSGGEPSAVFQLDVDGMLRERDALENTVLASGASGRRIVPAHEQQLRRVGQQLFEALFSERVLGTYRASLGIAQQRGEPLRVVLRLTAPQLAALPWEALFDPEIGAYLCRKEPLVRHVPAPYTREPLEITPPLRVLGLVSSPRGLPALDVAAEQEHLSKALATLIAEGLIELEWLTEASWEGVQEKLLSNQWHVLHFIGHGDYDVDTDQGVIALVGEDGRRNLVEAEQLADLLNEARPTPRLVVLNSCSSGEQGTQDLFSGTAAALVRSGINAVAAMQFTISDSAAIDFARGFYTAIAHGRSVDDASRSGRISMLGRARSLEWVTPVLYVRGESTQLFSLAPPERKGRRQEQPLAQGAPEPAAGQPGQTPPPGGQPTDTTPTPPEVPFFQRLNRRTKIVLAGFAVVATATVIIVANQSSSGGGTASQTSTTEFTAPSATTTLIATPSTTPAVDPTQRLLTAVPSDLHCTPSEVSGLAIASVNCTGEGLPQEEVTYSLFSDLATLNTDFDYSIADRPPSWDVTFLPCPGMGQSPQEWHRRATPQQSEGKVVCRTIKVGESEELLHEVDWTVDSQLVSAYTRGNFDFVFQWWTGHYQ